MLQVLQNAKTGKLHVQQVPDPSVRRGHVLVANAVSLISPGTEKMVMDLARKSILGKARARPDQVKQVLQKLRHEGFLQTTRKVLDRLEEPMPMGYCASGTVLACGDDVQEFKPGDRVAGHAPHASVVCIPRRLCARIPDGLTYEQGAFATLGAIAMHGVRLSRLNLGETAFVVGLGLVGQLTVALLQAAGCRVYGTDPETAKCAQAVRMGATEAYPGMRADAVAEKTGGRGADAVLLTAATESNEPIDLAIAAVRERGRIVLVGVSGLLLDRRPFYMKEAEFVVARSCGPGRYDAHYERDGHDYPSAYVRWTEQRNMQSFMDLVADGLLDVEPLISHRFAIRNADQAYEMINAGMEPYLGIMIRYPDQEERILEPRIELRSAPVKGRVKVGCLGAGHFARSVLLPAIQQHPDLHPAMLCSAGGTSAAQAGRKFGFDTITSDEEDVFGSDSVRAVFIATPHHLHAGQVVRALEAGQHVFVEKPLALSVEELESVATALQNAQPSAPHLMVGFNRRFSPATVQVLELFAGIEAPLTIAIRFNAGRLPETHWTQDAEIGGGRIIGEACHAIDLATSLAGAPPTRVYAESVGGEHAPDVTDDQCVISLHHANGSVSSIIYTAGGDPSFPKERVEVFGGGRVAVIDDFRAVTLIADGKRKVHRLHQQDKGHGAEIAAFATALTRGGASPISWDELRAATLASILAVRSIREGVPQTVS